MRREKLDTRDLREHETWNSDKGEHFNVNAMFSLDRLSSFYVLYERLIVVFALFNFVSV